MDLAGRGPVELAKREIGTIGLMRAGGRASTPAWCASPRPIRSTTTPTPTTSTACALELASHYPTLHLVGRNGMHKYNNQDHAMMTGMLTALNILAGDARLRRLAGQRGRRIRRSRPSPARRGAEQRAPGAPPRAMLRRRPGRMIILR